MPAAARMVWGCVRLWATAKQLSITGRRGRGKTQAAWASFLVPLPIFQIGVDILKKIRSYSSIWSVEKVIYAINDMRLPFPITFSQMAWFVACEFAVLALGL